MATATQRFCVIGEGQARVFVGERHELMVRFPECVVFPVTREQSIRIVNDGDKAYAYRLWCNAR